MIACSREKKSLHSHSKEATRTVAFKRNNSNGRIHLEQFTQTVAFQNKKKQLEGPHTKHLSIQLEEATQRTVAFKKASRSLGPVTSARAVLGWFPKTIFLRNHNRWRQHHHDAGRLTPVVASIGHTFATALNHFSLDHGDDDWRGNPRWRSGRKDSLTGVAMNRPKGSDQRLALRICEWSLPLGEHHQIRRMRAFTLVNRS